MRLWGIMEGEVESAETGRNGLQQRWEIWWLVDTAVRLTERAWEKKQLKEGRHMGGRGISRDCASHPGDVSKTFIKFVRTPFAFRNQLTLHHIFCVMASYANSWMSLMCHISLPIIPHSVSDTHTNRSFCSGSLNALYGCLGRQWCDTSLTSHSTSQAEWSGPLPR